MNYAESLKRLTEISELKYKQLADGIGYDNTYISKWINDKNIPSPKNHFYVNTMLSELFTRSITSDAKVDKLAKLFERQVPLGSTETIRSAISSLLQDSYFVSAKNFSVEDLIVKERDVFIGLHEILDGLSNSANMIIANMDSALNVITTNDMNYVSALGGQISYIYHVTKNIPVRFLSVIDEKSMQSVVESFEYFMMLLLKFGFYELRMVYSPTPCELQMTLIEDKIAYLFILGENSNLLMVTSSTDRWLLHELKKKSIAFIRKQTSCVRSFKQIVHALAALREMARPGNELVIYLSFLSGLILDEQMLRNLFEKHNIPPEIRKQMQDLRSIISLLFNGSKIRFVYSEESLYRSSQERVLDFCGIQVHLTKSEMKEYITHIKKVYDESANAEVYLCEEENAFIDFSAHKISFITDGHQALFIRDASLVDLYSMKFLLFEDERISSAFMSFLEREYFDRVYKKANDGELDILLQRTLQLMQ